MLDYPTPHVMIAVARFYPDIADHLVAGATKALDAVGAGYEIVAAPGAFELPSVVRMAVRSMDFFTGRRRFDGFVALGCVIRGETSHYDVVCAETARALQDLVVEHTLAFGFGLITCENREQAMARARADEKDVGGGAARACLAMLGVKHQFGLYPRCARRRLRSRAARTRSAAAARPGWPPSRPFTRSN